MANFKTHKDPIYGYISIQKDYSTKIIDTAVFQRLRRIVQTSYCPLYSSSVHNRFAHSIGVYHLGELAVSAISEKLDNKKWEIENFEAKKEVFLLACLLHDVGHAPFSHTGESFYLDDDPNEDKYGKLHKHLKNVVNSVKFDSDIPSNDMQAAAPHEIMSAIVGIESFNEFLPEEWQKEFFARCITGYKYSDSTLSNSFLNCLISLVNSKVIDVDKLDYLIRDAFFTGFDTITIDYKRLLSALTLVKVEGLYEIAYHKSAISVIENVVYAHDAERKWIQGHPTVLYEMYIIRHVMTRLSSELNNESVALFSSDSLGVNGLEFEGNLTVSLLCDDDIVSLMKNRLHDSLSNEFFQRNNRRHPIWKTESEYKNYLSLIVGKGDMLNNIKNALHLTEQYVSKNSINGVVDEPLLKKLNEDIEQLNNEDIHNKTTLLKQKKSILKIISVLHKYAETYSYKGKCDFVVLTFDQFYSGFNKPDVTDINIVFKNTDENPRKLGNVVTVLNSKDENKDKFFYIYHRKNQEVPDAQEAFTQLLIEEFNKK